MSVTGRYAKAFQSVESTLSNQKDQSVVLSFTQIFCNGNAAAKMFTVKQKNKLLLYRKSTGQVGTTTYSIYYSIKQVLSCFKTLSNKSEEFPFCKLPGSK